MGIKAKFLTGFWTCGGIVFGILLSQSHLIVKEIVQAWPVADSWEGRMESALFVQSGGAIFAAFLLGMFIVVRGYFKNRADAETARKERNQRDKHEAAAAERHNALMEKLGAIPGGSTAKKS